MLAERVAGMMRWSRWAQVAGLASCLAFITAISVSISSNDAHAGAPAAPPENFKVAFIGDQAIGTNAEAVLQLISDEGADMVIHLGDFGYGNETDPQTALDWDAQITSTLGASFPYFGVVGNHDVGNWSTYQTLLEDRLALVSGASCAGDYGVEAACTYQGLFFVLSGIGADPSIPADDASHISYLGTELAADDSIWSIGAWHKNQKAMKHGVRLNARGWGAVADGRAGVGGRVGKHFTQGPPFRGARREKFRDLAPGPVQGEFHRMALCPPVKPPQHPLRRRQESPLPPQRGHLHHPGNFRGLEVFVLTADVPVAAHV